MLNFTIFSIVIFVLILVLLIFTIKIYFETKEVKEKGVEKYNEISDIIKSEIFKNKQISQNLILAEDLQTSLFNCFFKITEDLLFVQKLIFDDHLN